MEVGIGTLGLSLLAGALSTLSPCVLPLLPVVLGIALAGHRRGPIALALGLAVSFTLTGVVLGAVGLYLGLNPDWVRKGGAVMLVLLGVVLLSTALQNRLAGAMSGVSTMGSTLTSRLRLEGLSGQFVLGLLLGLVWAPCVGPTLGAAATLASQRQSLAQVTLVMLVFAVGAALPLAVVGSLSREALLSSRGKLMRIGATGKYALGAILLLIGVSIMTGVDRRLESWLVVHSPEWLTDVTTRF